MQPTTKHFRGFLLAIGASALAALLGAVPLVAAQDGEANSAPSAIGRLDMFLDMHPDIATALMKNPGLAENAQYLASHPALQAFLTAHPALGEQLREHPGRLFNAEQRVDRPELRRAPRVEISPETKANIASFDSFLDNNPQIDRQLENHPQLLNDRKYMQNEPALRTYLESHPSVAQSLQADPAAFMRADQAYDGSGADVTFGQVETLDAFLDNNPAVARDFARNPSLMRDPAYIAAHPALQQMLSQNPGIVEASKEDPAQLLTRVSRYDGLTGTPPEAVRVSATAGRDRAMGDVADFDRFLDRNPDLNEQLRAHPELIASAQFRTTYPQLRSFLNSHPAVARQLSNNPGAFMNALGKFDKHQSTKQLRQERLNRRAPIVMKPGA